MSFSLHAEQDALRYAHAFFKSENYDEAVTEFKRHLFFHPNDQNTHNILYQVGLCFRNQEKWQEAINHIRKSMAICPNDSIQDERKIAIAIITISMLVLF